MRWLPLLAALAAAPALADEPSLDRGRAVIVDLVGQIVIAGGPREDGLTVKHQR